MNDERAVESVDRRMLARFLLRWETERTALDVLEREIKDLVLMLGETQTVGYVSAKYSKGRTTYDYELACRNH